MTDRPAENPVVMDGDLIADAVVNACPRILTGAAAREIAEKTLLNLSAIPGVVITRGPESQPWPVAPEASAPVETAATGTPDEEPWQMGYRPHVPAQAAPWTAEAFRWPGDG